MIKIILLLMATSSSSATAFAFRGRTTTGALLVSSLTSSGNIAVATNAKLCIDGSTCSSYITYDGSNLLLYRNSAQQVYWNGQLNSVVFANFSAQIGNSTANTPLVVNDAEGLGFSSKTLATCNGAIEWAIQADAASGVNTGKASKLCLCRSNGAAAYTWQNLATGTVGTNTVCGTE